MARKPLPDGLDASDPRVVAATARYWRSNVRTVLVLLAVWAAVGLGCGVLFAEPLNSYHVGGFPLGFWFAQQGAVLGFVLLVLAYALLMARLDRRHRADLERIAAGTDHA
ncbi:MAG: hypothetical protein RL148_2207 [Planctomycetota bacterium]|jgi:putative solute:sodium symporter small subunit